MIMKFPPRIGFEGFRVLIFLDGEPTIQQEGIYISVTGHVIKGDYYRPLVMAADILVRSHYDDGVFNPVCLEKI